MSHSQKLAVIGAGPMGLVCAYELLKQGHQVEVYEAADRIGGMSISFDFNGLEVEHYYHFICMTDTPLFDLLEELGLTDKLRWQVTKMGFYYRGKINPWGTPQALLSFPGLSLIDKARYALHVLRTKYIKDWRKLDKIDAIGWLQSWVGPKAYEILWERLFTLKCFEHSGCISAAWIGTRVQRIARSRKNLFEEQLGYLEGGSETLLKALAREIVARGGQIHLSQPVQQVIAENNRLVGIKVQNEIRAYRKVYSTAPLPYIPRLVPDLSSNTHNLLKNITNLGVVCVLLKLKQPFSEYFWLNINDEQIELPGVIEFTQLRPLEHDLLYAPFYLPHNHPKHQQDDQAFIEETLNYLQRMKPEFSRDQVLDAHVSRYEYAQTICSTGFFEQLPAMRSSLDGFAMADTAYCYPEDRSISESIRIAYQLARALD